MQHPDGPDREAIPARRDGDRERSPGHEDGGGTADDAEDERMLAELRAVVGRHDPVPDRVREAAVAAFSWLEVDAELAALAELDYDSLLDQRALAGVRGPGEAGGPRLITFMAPHCTVEVEVSTAGRLRRVVGQLVPPTPATVILCHGGENLETSADALGRFSAEGIRPGPVRITCSLPEAPHRVDTDWVTL